MYNNVTNFKHWFAVVCGTAFEIEIYGKELPAMAIKRVFQKEPVLSIAACLALVSSCFVLPDAEYLGYIDFRTLAILFSLMTVMAGLRGQGVFDRLGRALLSHTRTTLQLTAVLVGLCFFSSMVITNDVSLLTFVPFTFVVVNSLDAAVRDKLLLPIVCMQTISRKPRQYANTSWQSTKPVPVWKSGMDMGSFVLLMLPYSILSLALLALWAVGLCRRGAKISMAHSAAAASPNKALLSLYSILFVLCLLVVLRVLPYGIAFVAVLACVSFGRPEHIMPCGLFADPHLCCALYLYWQSGAFCRLSGWLQHILTGHEVWVSVLASQVTSNVPAAILLSGFTENIRSLIIGTNLGGLGTLIASMASLISYRRNCKGVAVNKRPVFCVVHSFQHPVSDSSYGRVGVGRVKTTSPHNSKHSRSGS